MTQRYATFFPTRLSQRVPSMGYDAQVRHGAPYRAKLGAPVALDADGILAATSISGTGSTTTFASTYSNGDTYMGKWGRGLSAVASTGSVTSKVYVRGRDFLGSLIMEQLTLNGTTQVNSLKAFKNIDRVDWDDGGSGVTLNLGWRDLFGLPYKFRAVITEIKNGIVTANAGTFTAGLTTGTTATATNADVRGTYLAATVLPDGTNTFEVIYHPDDENLHGNAQFYSAP